MKNLVAALMVFFVAAVGNGQTAKQANAFVRRMYTHYIFRPMDYEDLTGRNANRYFTPSLIALIRRDQEIAGPGFVGRMDFIPICECQDTDGMQLVSIHIMSIGPHTATGKVVLNSTPTNKKIPIELKLEWSLKHWRIDDVSTQQVPSLRKYLQLNP